jgi:hypothetical protein
MMAKKAPRLLALAAVVGWSLARAGSAQPITVVEFPQPNQTVSGVVAVGGFVLDTNRVTSIGLSIDGGDPVNDAVLNIARPDVLTAFPTFANGQNPKPGFVTSFLAKNVSDGPHTISLVITEADNSTATVSTPFTVVVDNTINQAPFGHVDMPGDGAFPAADGVLTVFGWALDDSDVDHIDFFVDGVIVATAVGRDHPGNAIFGGTRPDVFAAFPDFPGPNPKSLFSAFFANIDSSALLDGMHTLTVVATDDQGSSRNLGARSFQVENTGANLAPFGTLEYPLDSSWLICSPPLTVTSGGGGCPSPCTPGQGVSGLPNFFPNVVKGWALDLGARLDRGQVSFVELLLDGAIVANTRTDCVLFNNLLANCYGLNRPDVGQTYAGFVNANNSGFRFTFALSRDPGQQFFDVLIPVPGGVKGVGTPRLGAGKHTLSIRVGDEKETETELASLSVDLVCDIGSSSPDKASFGNIDSPIPNQYINGIFPIFGWAFDLDGGVLGGVTAVDVDIDGQVVATLTPANGMYGIFRPDVPANDFRVTTPFVGYSYLLDTTKLGNAPHDLAIYAFDRAGHRAEIGRRQFTVFNNNPTKD